MDNESKVSVRLHISTLVKNQLYVVILRVDKCRHAAKWKVCKLMVSRGDLVSFSSPSFFYQKPETQQHTTYCTILVAARKPHTHCWEWGKKTHFCENENRYWIEQHENRNLHSKLIFFHNPSFHETCFFPRRWTAFPDSLCIVVLVVLWWGPLYTGGPTAILIKYHHVGQR